MSRRGTFGLAWFLLSLAFALHVVDEALNDFLGVYNPIVEAMRDRIPALPLPTFEFGTWITGLVIAIFLVLVLTPFAWRGVAALVPLAWFYAVVMILNALLHFAGSVYLGRGMPGVYSSPILLAAALYLVASLLRRGPAQTVVQTRST